MKKSKQNPGRKLVICFCIVFLCLGGCEPKSSQSPTEDNSKLDENTEKPNIEQPQLSQEEIEYNQLVSKMEEHIHTMTLAEKVAQMFFVRCPETEAARMMRKYQFGGYLLFARDFESETKESVSQKIMEYQEQAKLPAFIGTDEEGGTVTRISKYSAFRSKSFSSPRVVFQNGGWSAIEQDTVEKADLLLSLGVNVNFAPVCDIARSRQDFIYDRAFGTSEEEVSEYTSLVVNTMNDQRIGAVLKHFPGYGDNKDTHTGIAYDKRTLEEFRSNDFLPFKAGIQANTPFILVSHNIVQCLDNTLPASLSKKVINVLRGELDYENLIITDDLSMDAITKYTDDKAAAVLAIQAGNDMVCCSNYSVQIKAVIDAVNFGEITESRIDESVLRILITKYNLGIMSE